MKQTVCLILALLMALSFIGCTTDNLSSVLTQVGFENSSSFEDSSNDTSSKTTSFIENSSVFEGDSSSPLSSTQSSLGVSSEIISSNITTSESPSSNTSSKPNPPESVFYQPINPEIYSCYSALDNNKKSVYNALFNAANNMEPAWIDIPVSKETSVKDMSLLFHSLGTDHPELFWLPTQYYVKILPNKISFLFMNEGSDSNPKNSTYLIDNSQKDYMVSLLNAAVEEIKSLVTATDPYEIELQLHDILCQRVTYYEGPKTDPMLWTAYGALVNREAVCEGYARAYQLLLYEFGINNTLATGTANGTGHMWNIVNINGANYHVDVTWDDSEASIPSHAYFNLTDSEITKTHSPHVDFTLINDSEFESDNALNYNFNLPSCKDNSLNYFKVTGAIFSKGDEIALADYIISTCGSVEIQYIDEAPDFSFVNSFLLKRKSTLQIRMQVSKPSTTVIILEVE